MFVGRFFNTAGPCRPEQHYMVPAEARIPGVRDLIDAGLYVVVHAARQTGKTTSFLELAEALTREGRYAALLTTCERGQAARGNVEMAEAAVVQTMLDKARLYLAPELRPPAAETVASAAPGNRLATLLHRWCEACPRPVVLFLDEIDALYDDSLISVLRQLRGGYADGPRGFPQSVALIGLRDVRDYRARIRPELSSMGTASPFNVKVDSITLRDFTAHEVAALYGQHAEQTGQSFSDEAVARAFELTEGQPWLVNALAFQITWRDLKRDTTVPITLAHVEAAKETLVERRDTHLDSLADKLREPRVRRIIEPILAGEASWAELPEDDLRYVEDLGLVRARPAIRIANPIYREVIPRALSWTTQVRIAHEPAWYISAADGSLDMPKLLEGFAAFWMEHAEALLMHQLYPEAAPHLVLLAFLQRIVNGGGTIQREYAVGMGRMDVLVRWPLPGGGEQREALEIKVWRDKKADPLAHGLDQLSDYLDRLGLATGTLAIFDRRTDAPPPHERTAPSETTHRGRTLRILRA